jgi:pimeloyl-ACP methyl ester carboxylesterase
MPRATVNGIDTHFEVAGRGQPLLFIHGGYGGAASTLAPPQAPDLLQFLPLDRVMVVTYDRRNSGRSQYVLEQYSQADLAADAVALLDHLRIESAIVYGTSAGGPIALQLALAHPDRVQALCLTCTGSYLMRERPRTTQIKAWLELADREGERALFESRREALRNPPPAASIRHPEQRRGEAEREAELRKALAVASDGDLFIYATGSDFTPRLAEIRVPTIVVHGTADGTVPFAWGEALHRGIAGSEFHAIEGADHGVSSWPEGARVLREWVVRQIADASRPPAT